MKRWHWLVFSGVLAVAAGLTIVALPQGAEWTTSSPEALAEFEAGEEARRKVYGEEARKHFKRAHEIDPDFLFAALRVLQFGAEPDPQRAQRLLSMLLTADLSGLTPRERFFIEYWRANHEGRSRVAAELLDECVEKYPEDPYILATKAGQAWMQGELEEAERLFQRVLAIDPNWVGAYNALGYINMMQGRFIEAEERFKSYRFIAPDQANPHDSLGELLITVGRYAEADASLERAIEIKADFWASYVHLAILKAYAGQAEAIGGIIERARTAGVPEEVAFELDCLARYAAMANREDWRGILELRESDCVSAFRSGLAALVTHRAACRTGDWETARAIEDEASGVLARAESAGDREGIAGLRAAIHHMHGIRLATAGDLDAATENLRAADNQLGFIRVDLGMYKLFNRMVLVETLLANGNDVEAHKLLAEIRRVNPTMVDDFESSGLTVLGLGRS